MLNSLAKKLYSTLKSLCVIRYTLCEKRYALCGAFLFVILFQLSLTAYSILTPDVANAQAQYVPQIGIGSDFTAGSAKTVPNSTQLIAEYIVAIYKYAIGIVGIIAAVVIMAAGLVWLTSAGNPEKIGLAKNLIGGSVIGLVLAFGAYTILNTINPALVDLKPVGVAKVTMGSSFDYGQSSSNSSDAINLPILGSIVSLSSVNCSGDSCSFPWIGQTISAIYNYAIGLVGIMAAVGLMVGGVIYLTAGSNTSKVGQAKEWIKGSLIGLVIVLSSYLILNQINPSLVSFNNINVNKINTPTQSSLTESTGAGGGGGGGWGNDAIKFTPQVSVGDEFQAGKGVELSANTQTIGKYIKAIYNYAIGIVGILAAVIVMFGGVKWTTAGGDASKTGEAKSWIMGGILGLMLVFFSVVILNTINPALINFNNPDINNIKEFQESNTTANTANTNPTSNSKNIIVPNLQVKIPGLESLSTEGVVCEVGDNGKIKSCTTPWIGKYINAIYNFALGFVGILSAVVLMIAGIIWLTAGGDSGRVASAKEWISGSLIGLVIAFASYTILYQINPSLTSLQGTTLSVVQEPEIDSGNILTKPITTPPVFQTPPGAGNLTQVEGIKANKAVVARADVAERLKYAQAIAKDKYGVELYVVSSYRTFEHQSRLWNNALKKYGSAEKARKWVSPPGRSEHETGRAIDLGIVGTQSVSRILSASAVNDGSDKMLANIMSEAGFTNYPVEFWHWSIKDPSNPSLPPPTDFPVPLPDPITQPTNPTVTPAINPYAGGNPALQIEIPGLSFSQPEQCSSDWMGRPIYCVKWTAEYIQALFNYAIGLLGILAAVAMMIGGFLWLTAGGDTGRIGTAKSWMVGSISGLVIGLSSFLILNQINPNLVNLEPIRVTKVDKAPFIASPNSTWITKPTSRLYDCNYQAGDCASSGLKAGSAEDCAGKTNSGSQNCCCKEKAQGGCGWHNSNTYGTCENNNQKSGSDTDCGTKNNQQTDNLCCCGKGIECGKCKSVNEGACAISNMSAFGDRAAEASAICNLESTNGTNIYNCYPKSGHSANCATMVGAFQVNIAMHLDKTPPICKQAFNSGNYTIKDAAAHQQCVALVSDLNTNIAIAKKIFDEAKGRWTPWEVYTKAGMCKGCF